MWLEVVWLCGYQINGRDHDKIIGGSSAPARSELGAG